MKGLATVLLVAGATLCVLSRRAEAEDLNPPEWRGEANTCYAVWRFSEDVMPDEADVWVGPPSGAEVTEMGGLWEVGEPGIVGTEYRDSVEGRSGVRAFDITDIDLDGDQYSIQDMLGFRLDNYPDSNAQKQIRVQLVWMWDGSHTPYLEASAAGCSGGEASLLGDVDLGDGWTHSTYEMVLQPNPLEETVFLASGDHPDNYFYLDEVIIDTRCVPEPSTVIFLATGFLGLVAYRWRRRHR